MAWKCVTNLCPATFRPPKSHQPRLPCGPGSNRSVRWNERWGSSGGHVNSSTGIAKPLQCASREIGETVLAGKVRQKADGKWKWLTRDETVVSFKRSSSGGLGGASKLDMTDNGLNYLSSGHFWLSSGHLCPFAGPHSGCLHWVLFAWKLSATVDKRYGNR